MPLDDKLAAIHEALFQQIDFVDRISVAAYDEATDLLKTFLSSSPGRNDLVCYEARLADSPSLAEILRTGRPRVVDDLELFRQRRHLHTKIIAEDGLRTLDVYAHLISAIVTAEMLAVRILAAA